MAAEDNANRGVDDLHMYTYRLTRFCVYSGVPRDLGKLGFCFKVHILCCWPENELAKNIIPSQLGPCKSLQNHLQFNEAKIYVHVWSR
jgi:hypothetical protein